MSSCTGAYLELSQIDKDFGITHALQKMSLSIHLGEIIGLVGANGAGKSTLMKVITGAHQPTQGEFRILGKNVLDAGYGPQRAKKYGINCAYQELSLCTNLTVYENFVLGQSDHSPFGKAGWRRIARKDARRKIEAIFPSSGIDVNKKVSHLPLAKRQMVEIARAASTDDLKVLLLDEPTSSLAGNSITQLHEAMRKLSRNNISIIYITHKLYEIYNVCDRIVVMKSGRVETSGSCEKLPIEKLVSMFGGQERTRKEQSAQKISYNETLVSIEGLTKRVLKDINLKAHRGEIVGISGLAGAGQKELLDVLYDAFRHRHKKGIISIGSNVAYISGDRQEEGIFQLWNIADNINVSSLIKLARYGFVLKNRFRALAQEWYKKLSFTAEGIDTDITSLSGGNQQKALIARGLASGAEIILLNDPTCGVDVQTKGEIYSLLEEARSQGKTVIWRSTEDFEMEQCDTVYVMHNGRIVERFTGNDITESNIIRASFIENLSSQGKTNEIHEHKSSMGTIRAALSHGSFLAIATLAAIFIINVIIQPNVLSYNGMRLLFSSAVPLIFVAIGQMFIVVSGGIDMGNMMALAYVTAITARVIQVDPLLAVLLYATVILGYALIGTIIHFTGIPAIIVTLGASYIWQGLALIVGPVPGGSCPTWLMSFFKFKFPIIPMPIVLAIVAATIAYWIVKRSKYGMVINGIGNNKAAVERAGWSRFRATLTVYILSGIFVILGGLMLTAVANAADATATVSYQMKSIATIIMGGCEFVGGIAEPVGVVAAAFAISTISALLTFIGINSNFQMAVTGIILIASLAIRMISKKMEAKS